jgi:hypothetical protein
MKVKAGESFSYLCGKKVVTHSVEPTSIPTWWRARPTTLSA